jgi:ribosomal protein S18 acetylase RimI-like enzyme
MDFTMHFKIRNMIKIDIPFVQQLYERSGIDLTLIDSKIEIERMINYNKNLCLVGIDTSNENKIVSAVLGGFDGRRGWVHHLAVDPNYRRKKLGTLLMEELLLRFKKLNVVKVKLEILRSNLDVVDFYKQQNWDYRDDLVTMSYNLRK